MTTKPLAQLVDERLRAAGIGEDDPGLVKLRQWNADVWGRAGVPPVPEPVGQPPSESWEGRDAMGMTTCGREGCDADIEWALPVDEGKTSKMPVDYWSAGDQRGTLAIHRIDGVLRYRMLTRDRPDLRRGEKRGVAHWVTCKNPPPRKRAGKDKCTACGHAHGATVCAALGKVECRMGGSPAGEGLIEMRGRFPCGCTHGVPGDCDACRTGAGECGCIDSCGQPGCGGVVAEGGEPGGV